MISGLDRVLVLSQEITMAFGRRWFLLEILDRVLKETDLAGIHVVAALVQQSFRFGAREISQG